MRAGRRRLWELDGVFHCSIIGTCLTQTELKQYCRKLRISLQAPLTDYAPHRAFVNVACRGAPAARCLNRYLDRKYRDAMQQGDRQLRLEGQVSELQVERDALETALGRLLAPDCSACSGRDGCNGDINLCGRRILYVGGRERQCTQFRALVEQRNGRFMHHDGGLHGGRLRLGSLLPKADAVLCPR